MKKYLVVLLAVFALVRLLVGFAGMFIPTDLTRAELIDLRFDGVLGLALAYLLWRQK